MATEPLVSTKRHKTIECPISRARCYDCFHDGTRTVVEVRCDKCPATHRVRCSPGANVASVADRIRPDGWMADSEGRNALCPDCKKPKRERGEIPIGKPSAPPPPANPRPDPRAAPLTSKPLAKLDALVSVLPPAKPPTPPTPPAAPKPPAAPVVAEASVYMSERASKTAPHLAPRLCARAGCGVTFKPDRVTHLYHSPECSKQHHLERRRKTTMPPTMSTHANTPEAIRAERLMYQLLDDHYDEATHLFDDGWTDERIAKDCSVSALRVRTCREALYGRPVSAELLKIRDDIAAELLQTKKDRETLESMARDTIAELRSLVKEALDRRLETLKELAARVSREIGSDS